MPLGSQIDRRSLHEDLRTFALLLAIFILVTGCTATRGKAAPDLPFVTSSKPIRLLSANDGDALKSLGRPNSNAPDSLTIIDLSSDAPPVTRTVSGTVPVTYNGAPISAVISDGRYAFVPSHDFGYKDGEAAPPNQVTVVDLGSPNLPVIAEFELPPRPWQAMAHPDDQRVFVISDHHFHIFKINSGRAEFVSKSAQFPLYLLSFAISPDGKSIIATARDKATVPNGVNVSTPFDLHLFSIEADTVNHVRMIGIKPGIGEIDQPFAPRFSPDGSRVLVLNGLGLAGRPPLDAVLSIDMSIEVPRVTESIPNVGQGLESLAFHPTGQFAVVTCIDGPLVGHLALVDLTTKPMRVLYYLPMTFVPQGIEFSPDGSMLFVQSASAGHIDVYKVNGMKLERSPYVLRTGEGPASMAIISR